MTRIRIALAATLLLSSGAALAFGSYDPLSSCASPFETIYVEDLRGAQWIDGTAGTRACT
jgi:hypothetical protein